MEGLIYFVYALVGILMGSALSILPGLHIYSLAAISIILFVSFPSVDPLGMAMVFTGLLVAFAIVNAVTSTFMSTPDDSLRYSIFPNQKYLMAGRGYEASIIGGMGALGAMLILLLLAPFASLIFPVFRKLATPHMPWMLIGCVVYLLQTEWPKDWGSRAKTRFGRLKDGWASLSAGWLVFFLSMMMGFILLNMPVTSLEKSFQGAIMPAFSGFVAVPWVLTNAMSKFKVPQQNIKNTFYVSKKDMVRGTTTGFLGGMFSAYNPMISGGVGGLMASHATVTGGDIQFMVSGSAARFTYFVGGFFLIWVPFLHLIRKGLANIMVPIFSPKSEAEFWLFMAVLAISAVIAFLVLILVSRLMSKIIPRFSYRKVSFCVLAAIIALVLYFGGWAGLVIMVIATGIGLTQIMFRTRWANIMVGYFFPAMLSMAGLAAPILKILGIY
jgi:putative membrane protein